MPRAELARLCRQICLTRERERPVQRSFEAEFLSALAEIQTQFGAASATEDDLWVIAAREDERVSDASLFAEILLPKLAALLRTRVESTPTLAASHSTPPVPGATERIARPAAPLGIADLIDGMLSQERK